MQADLLVQLLRLLHTLIGPGSRFVEEDEQVSVPMTEQRACLLRSVLWSLWQWAAAPAAE